jgi:hypothetical protein
VAVDDPDDTSLDLPDSLDNTSDEEDIEMNESSPQQPLSKLSLLTNPADLPRDGRYVDTRLKQDEWLLEKPDRCLSRDVLFAMYLAVTKNRLNSVDCPVIFLAHPGAAHCPIHQTCTHWELRWEDRPRREPGSIELELFCLDPKAREMFAGPELCFFDHEHRQPIKCEPSYLFNALKPNFSSLKATNLDLVLFRMVEPRNESGDELDGEAYDQKMAFGLMDQYGRHFVTVLRE